MLKDGFRYCQTPLGKRITCQSLLVASLLLAQQDDPEPVNQCSQGEKHPVAGLEVLKGTTAFVVPFGAMTAFRRHGDPRVITVDGFEPPHAALRRTGMNNEFNYRSRRRRPDPRWTVWHKAPVSRTTRLNGLPCFAKTTPACCPRSVRRPSATRSTLIRISFQDSDQL